MVLLIFAIISSAQQLKFVKSIGGLNIDEAEEIIQTSDNCYVLIGYTTSYGAGGYDMIITKLDRFGSHIWTRVIGDSLEDHAYSLVETNDNSLVVAGTTTSSGAGNYDIILVKLDANGSLIWTKTIGGANEDNAYHIIKTADDGFALAGGTRSYGNRHLDIFVVKIDSLANFSWATTMGWYFGNNPANEEAKAIIQTSDKGYAITGTSTSFAPNNEAIVLCKIDSSGNFLWHRNLGVTGGTAYDAGNFLLETPDKGLVLAGETEDYTAGGGRDLLLSKFDSAGTHLWTRTWGGSGLDAALCVALTEDNGFMISGLTQSYGAGSDDIMLSKFDSLGNHQWSRTIGGLDSDIGNSLTLTNNNGIAITGSTESFGLSSVDMILAKCDSAGIACIGDSVTPVLTSPSPSIGTEDAAADYPTPVVQDVTQNVLNITPDVALICGETTLPDSFNLISPPDSTVFAIARPTFIWTASYDSLSDLIYEIYIEDTFRATVTDTFWTADYNLIEEYNDWYVVAYDSADNSTRSNETWTVIIDTSGPFIDSTTIWADTTYSGPFPIYTKVTGLNEIDTVRLYYKRLEDPGWLFIDMIEDANNWYYENIPSVSQYNDTVKYYIFASDTLPDSATDPPGAPSNYYSFIVLSPPGIDEENETPEIFSFSVNPIVRDKSIFRFSLPEKATISLIVYDVTGRSVWELDPTEYPIGYYEITFTAKRKGIYFYEFKSPYKDAKGKLVIF